MARVRSVSTSYVCYMILFGLWKLIVLLFKLLSKIVSIPFKLLIYLFRRKSKLEFIDYTVENIDKYLEDGVNMEKEEVVCPEFAQIFNLPNDLVLGIERLERCPEETALVRIVGHDWVSKQYKRKVYSCSAGRYIQLDGNKYFLKEKVQVN